MNHTWEKSSSFGYLSVEARLEVCKGIEDMHCINYHVGQRRGNRMSLKPPPTHTQKLTSLNWSQVCSIQYISSCSVIKYTKNTLEGRKITINIYLISQLSNAMRATNEAKKSPTSQIFFLRKGP